MPGRRLNVLEIREVVRRIRLGDKDRRIARELGLSRNTVAKYRTWAEREGYLEAQDLPGPGVLDQQLRQVESAVSPPGPESKAEPFREYIERQLDAGVEVKALLALLRERGFSGSYSSLRRFIEKHRFRGREVFVRVETSPGDEAQVDFGYAGLMLDEQTGRQVKTWVFVMTLGYSRHMYVELVQDQKIETWLALHVRAFEWFGAVPRRIVIDNLRSGIAKVMVYDAEAQRCYRELAEHYGFVISPCRPRTPRHKGKVESGVHYVRRNALAGRDFSSRGAANEHLRKWALEVAGTRIHGTTHEQPLARFEREQPELLPLPSTRFELVIWKQAKAHRDCHVVFESAYYSFPHRHVGKELWVRRAGDRVELYLEYERIASHDKARRKGEWKTMLDHYPPEKLPGLLPRVEVVKAEALAIGPETAEFVERLLGQRPMDRLRGAFAIVRLTKRYAAQRIERACARALAFDEIRCYTVKEILRKGLDSEFQSESRSQRSPLPKTSIFARPLAEIVGTVAV